MYLYFSASWCVCYLTSKNCILYSVSIFRVTSEVMRCKEKRKNQKTAEMFGYLHKILYLCIRIW